jgi:S1-C subfamily serine protease
MVLGGLVLEALSEVQFAETGLAPGAMALGVKHVGQYGPHAAARDAGFQQGDIVVDFNDRDDLLRETDLLAYALDHTKPGDQVTVTVLREGKRVKLTMPIQP